MGIFLRLQMMSEPSRYQSHDKICEKLKLMPKLTKIVVYCGKQVNNEGCTFDIVFGGDLLFCCENFTPSDKSKVFEIFLE